MEKKNFKRFKVMLIVINAFQTQTTNYNSMAVPAVINTVFIKFPSKDVPKIDL